MRKAVSGDSYSISRHDLPSRTKIRANTTPITPTENQNQNVVWYRLQLPEGGLSVHDCELKISIVSIGPIANIVFSTLSDMGVMAAPPVTPAPKESHENASETAAAVPSPPASVLFVSLGVSAAPNVLGRSGPPMLSKRPRVLFTYWFCSLSLCACCVAGLFEFVDWDPGLVLAAVRQPLFVFVFWWEVLELGVGRSEDWPSAGDSDMSITFSGLMRSCIKLEPKVGPLFWRIFERKVREFSLNHGEFRPLKPGIGC